MRSPTALGSLAGEQQGEQGLRGEGLPAAVEGDCSSLLQLLLLARDATEVDALDADSCL